MTRRPEIRPATAEDFEAFYGKAERRTARAYVADLDGKVLAIGGVYYDGANVIAFSSMASEMRQFPLTIMRGARKIMDLVRGRPCWAVADDGYTNAPRLLERLGFSHVSGRVYRWTS